MNTHSSSIIDKFLCWWGTQVLRFSWFLIFFTLILTAISIQYTATNLGINTNPSELISPDLPFQKNRLRIEAEFPQDAGAILLVVDALTPEETTQTANQLAQLLSEQPDAFSSVYVPTENDFFKQQAFLFLEQDELEELETKLTNAQPFIGYLAQNYHLEGLLDIISQALQNKDQNLPMDLDPLLHSINDTVTHQLNGQPYRLSWQNLLTVNKFKTEKNRTLVIARPKLNFDEILPAEHALTTARKTINHIMQETPGVTVRITGEPALEHEELESVTEGAVIAGIVSLILVCTSLWMGLRSFKLLFATFIVLILGLILTAGFATLSVGHLNLISIAFAILYIGLGVDYAIHVCLHYREYRSKGLGNNESIIKSIQDIGFSIFLCALTTSIGFLAFIPTDYSGVSELGIISAGGMFIGMAISLTLLPALLTVFSVKNAQSLHSTINFGRWSTFPFKYSISIRIISIIVAILSCFLLTKIVFDSNPINLRDPNSESVSTIKELLASQNDSPFALTSLAPNVESATQLANKLEQLPSVHNAIFISSLVAENQDEKLEIIEELDLILGNQLNTFENELKNGDPKQALISFNSVISEVLKQQSPNAPRATLEQLQKNITLLINSSNDLGSEPFDLLEKNILGLLPYTMDRLKSSLAATPYQLADIPDYLSQHWVSKNGRYKILITPEHDQNEVENLKQFVSEVQTAAPSSSGLSVADQASGTAVVQAFIQAFAGAIIAISLLLLIILRNIKETLLVVGPLLFSALLTVATNVLLDNPFNFANIIALPLLMGMGVDSSIHIMQRLKSGLSNRTEILQSSTARGVFFSALTTLCSFSSLAFTPHVGTASMGLLLAIGIFFTLLCTLIVLPAFYGNKN
ncbi:MAG: MMPL family transporter [Methylococcales bacterium]|nr:MMPL family transporter [Methylococcales bacterium]